ncbi:hypothetical protein FA10DRAFT_260628 [Acaromyces ingoldii]|uniref:Uncharacterized protein n=1 Tax=Acaromyces ingoldii TaxID=215250 RepID=A0A316YPC2_9BASI|nr:hypothetical protein FA10DRAFT_260628 [Acaromyces ingoldii]PWN90876.1 hypothetical protein FA10DRAFT_260628 [Acaromyces ingoldii]
MHCLRWWLPLFILPLPAASPYLLLLFVLAYAIKTKPCAYCSFIVVGLMISTASWYDSRNLVLSPTSTTTTTTAPQAAPPVTCRASCPAEPDPFHHLLGSVTPACALFPPPPASRSSRLAQQRRKRGNQASYYWLSVSHFVWNFCGHVGTKRSITSISMVVVTIFGTW